MAVLWLSFNDKRNSLLKLLKKKYQWKTFQGRMYMPNYVLILWLFSKICITLTFNSQSPSCNIFSWSSNSLINVVIALCYGYCEIRFLLTWYLLHTHGIIWFYFINSVNSKPKIFYITERLVKLKIQRKVLYFNPVPVTGESSLSRETRPTRAPCWKRRGKEEGEFQPRSTHALD